MDFDPLSPIAPARVVCLLLPIAKISSSRFAELVGLIRQHNVLRLSDIKPDGRPNRAMFSPLGFPSGSIMFDFSTSMVPPSRLQLSPFEIFREPLVVLAIADGSELGIRENVKRSSDDVSNENVTLDLESLEAASNALQERWPRVLVRQTLLFESTPRPGLSEHITSVHATGQMDERHLNTVMCNVASSLLAEMTTYAKSLQGLETIESPRSLQSFTNSNGNLAAQDRWNDPLRRNSQFTETSHQSRLKSASDEQKASYRMSMPAHLPSSQSEQFISVSSPRPTSPETLVKASPATTFEAMSTGPQATGRMPSTGARARPSAVPTNSDHSRERVSVSGFGSGSLSERARNKGKGRIGVAIGSMYLLSGRWNDCLKELSQSAGIAKANSDHLWHGKALEHILVCLLLYAWAGLAFEIPEICLSASDHPFEAARSPKIKLANNQAATDNADDALKESLGAFQRIIPELTTYILNLYVRVANFAGEQVLQLPFSESAIRLSKLLGVVNLEKDHLNERALDTIFGKKGVQDSQRTSLIPRNVTSLNRAEITEVLLRGYPPTSHDLSVTDHALILGGIASVFGLIGFHRKKAIIMLELISVLIPGLADARKAGAAELGIHPAAGLAALNTAEAENASVGSTGVEEGDMTTNVRGVLQALNRLYGLNQLDGYSKSATISRPRDSGTFNGNSDLEISQRLSHAAMLATFGSQSIKSVVLRTCVNLCQALPDFQGVLQYTSVMLRATTQSTPQTSRLIHFTREEQIKLANNISRTVMVARKLGAGDIEADYWDERLLSRVEVVDLPSSKKLHKHSRDELEPSKATKEVEKSPFLYNPFLKKVDTVVAKQMVKDELSEFKVSLHNPFEFNLGLEFIRLEVKGVVFESRDVSMDLSPNSIQSISLWGTPRSSGRLHIDGCIAKIRGCRSRRFPILQATPSSISDLKIKQNGLGSLSAFQSQTPPTSNDDSNKKDPSFDASQFPVVTADVLEAQPLMTIESISLSQSSIMLLEGERRKFTISLRNVSPVPVDFVAISFKDSTEAPLQTAMGNKNVTPAELYELELMYSRKPAFSWEHEDQQTTRIDSGQTRIFEISVFGKPGLTEGLIQVDYGLIDAVNRPHDTSFHTRQLVLAVNVTVNATVEIIRGDCLPHGSSHWALTQKSDESKAEKETNGFPLIKSRPDLFNDVDFRSTSDDHFVLSIDIRNAWPTPFAVTIQSYPTSLSANASTSSYTTHATVQPGHTERLMIPMRRVFIRDPQKAIPSLNPSKNKRFRNSGIISEAERSIRESFWYKEDIVNSLKGTWYDQQLNRTGAIEMRGIRLPPRFVDIVRVEDVTLSMSVTSKNSMANKDDDTISRFGSSSYRVVPEEFSILQIKIKNRTARELQLIVRIQPSLANQSHHLGLDMTRRMAWSGLMQRPIPPLAAGESTEIEAGFCVLCSGRFEIGISAEEIKNTGKLDSDSNSRQSEEIQSSDAQRGIWNSRRPCLILAEHNV